MFIFASVYIRHKWNYMMSEDKRKNLEATLSSLSNEDKAWVINFLVQGLFPMPAKRKAKKNRGNELSDEQWEEYFEHQPSVAFPEETTAMNNVLSVTSGHSIKQIEKWL